METAECFARNRPYCLEQPDEAMMEDLLHELAAKYPDLKDELYRAIVEDTKTEHLMEFTNHGN